MDAKKQDRLLRKVPAELEKDNQSVVIEEVRRSGIVVYHAFTVHDSKYYGYTDWHWRGSRFDEERLRHFVEWAFPSAGILDAPLFTVKT